MTTIALSSAMAPPTGRAPARGPALALFRASVAKQTKWREIMRALGPTDGLRGLDIGADSGVISWLLRRRGGSWTSADLDAESVASIRELVGDRVVQLEGPAIPLPDSSFDRIVLVDCVEHLADDRAFLAEVARVAAPGARVLINVPVRADGWLRRARLALGQTDAAHGHVRPGYTVEELRAALGPSYEWLAHRTYSRDVAEVVDLLLRWIVSRMKRPAAGGAKGAFVTGADLSKHRRLIMCYRIIYPAVWLVTRLDHLLWFRRGSMLLVTTWVNK